LLPADSFAKCFAGLYEQQDPDQRDLNLRGQFVTDEDGKYSFYCLRPTPYPVSSTLARLAYQPSAK